MNTGKDGIVQVNGDGGLIVSPKAFGLPPTAAPQADVYGAVFANSNSVADPPPWANPSWRRTTIPAGGEGDDQGGEGQGGDGHGNDGHGHDENGDDENGDDEGHSHNAAPPAQVSTVAVEWVTWASLGLAYPITTPPRPAHASTYAPSITTPPVRTTDTSGHAARATTVAASTTQGDRPTTAPVTSTMTTPAAAAVTAVSTTAAGKGTANGDAGETATANYSALLAAGAGAVVLLVLVGLVAVKHGLRSCSKQDGAGPDSSWSSAAAAAGDSKIVLNATYEHNGEVAMPLLDAYDLPELGAPIDVALGTASLSLHSVLDANAGSGQSIGDASGARKKPRTESPSASVAPGWTQPPTMSVAEFSFGAAAFARGTGRVDHQHQPHLQVQYAATPWGPARSTPLVGHAGGIYKQQSGAFGGVNPQGHPAEMGAIMDPAWSTKLETLIGGPLGCHEAQPAPMWVAIPGAPGAYMDAAGQIVTSNLFGVTYGQEINEIDESAAPVWDTMMRATHAQLEAKLKEQCGSLEEEIVTLECHLRMQAGATPTKARQLLLYMLGQKRKLMRMAVATVQAAARNTDSTAAAAAAGAAATATVLASGPALQHQMGMPLRGGVPALHAARATVSPRAAASTSKRRPSKPRAPVSAAPKRKSKISKSKGKATKQAPKLKPVKTVDVEEWRLFLQLAAKKALGRLKTRTDPQRRADIMARVEHGAGADVPGPTGQCRPCYYVERERKTSKSPFQLPVAGSRIYAQKVVYSAYRHLEAADMGTWQVYQRCLHNNNDWWCFEPSHLVKCERDHVPANTKKFPMPVARPDAYYVIRGQPAAAVDESSDCASISDPASSPSSEGSPS